ncbi:MAG: T9SS type A sorting domain-containing protein [Chlorobi bacterium]|nr:T9SS type A sorting domain-containing protein [Chlorobiota bacterium]
MKKPILYSVLFLILSIGAFSQNYQCINNNSIHYFTDGEFVKAIQIDSVVVEGDNSVFYNYPTIAETEEFDCFTQYGPSWIGCKMLVEPDGVNVFYNMDSLPITIRTLAGEGEQWIIYEFYTGYYILATVEEIVNMDFLGITDMVKKITFQAMGSNGTPVVHPVNDMYMLLSENHGLVQTLNFKVFPDLWDSMWEDGCHEYELWGLDNPSIGTQNLTKEQIFDLNVGDEYHTEQVNSDWVAGTYQRDLMIYNIIDKKVSANGDSLKYQASRCGRKEAIENGVTEISLYNDTIGIVYVLQMYEHLDTIPEKMIVDEFETGTRAFSYNTQEYFTNSEKMLKRKWDGLYSDPPYDCIYQIIVKSKNPGYGDVYFVEGIGGPFWDYGYFPGNDFRHLLYFNVDGEEWGNPLDCDSLLLGIQNNRADQQQLKIVPNPMTRQSILEFENPNQQTCTLYLYDIYGKKAGEWETRGNQIQIKKGKLVPGIYMLKLYKEGSFAQTGKLIID